MELRQLANTLWAMGKMRMDIVAEIPVGPSLVAALEERILAELETRRLSEPRDAEQLLQGLRGSNANWSLEFVRAVVHQAIVDMPGWADRKAIAQSYLNMALLARRYDIQLDTQQRQQLAGHIASCVADWPVPELAPRIDCLLTAAVLLRLPLPPAAVRRLFDIVTHMPLRLARQRSRIQLARMLYCFARKLGCQPTEAEAELWHACLVRELPQQWTHDDFSWTAAALSCCRNFSPPAQLTRSLLRVAEAVAGARSSRGGVASRLLMASRAWKVELPPYVEHGLLQQAVRRNGSSG